MLVWFGMAARNLLRHKRRSVLTGAMICVGTIAAVLALSYGQSSAAALTNAVVQSVTGHLQIRAASSRKIDVVCA